MAETHHGITFNTVLNAVTDLGMDDTGGSSITSTLENNLNSDTLIEFPPGTYLCDGRAEWDNVSNVGVRSTTGNAEDVTFTMPPGSYIDDLMHWDGGGGAGSSTGTVDNVLIEGITFDHGDRNEGFSSFVIKANNFEVHDVHQIGFKAEEAPEPVMYLAVVDENGVGNADQVYIDGGGVEESYPQRTHGIYSGGYFDSNNDWVDGVHKGLLRITNADLRELGSTGIRYTSMADTAAVQIEDSYFENIDNACIRLNTGNNSQWTTWIKNSEFVNDASLLRYLPSGEVYAQMDQIRLERTNIAPIPYGVLVEGCTFKQIEWPNSETWARSCVGRMNDCGGFTVKDCTFEVYEPVAAIDAKQDAPSSVPVAVTVDNCVVTGEPPDGGGAYFEEAMMNFFEMDGTEVKNGTCISVSSPGANIDGILFNNLSNASVTDVNIDVDGTDIATLNGATYTSSNVTNNAGCDPLEPSPETTRFTIEGLASSPCGDFSMDYSFDVDGGVSHGPNSANTAAEGYDSITDNGDGTYTVSGTTSDGATDDWDIDTGSTISNWSATDRADGTTLSSDCYARTSRTRSVALSRPTLGHSHCRHPTPTPRTLPSLRLRRCPGRCAAITYCRTRSTCPATATPTT
jgi:hypothetical protein